MEGVDIKTVRAYDPMRRTSKPEVQAIKEPEKSTPDIELYKGLTELANWVTILSIHLPGKIYCPNCLFPSGLELEKKSKPRIMTLKQSTQTGNKRKILEHLRSSFQS